MSVQSRAQRLAAIKARAQVLVAEAPPLTAEQLDRLSSIFRRRESPGSELLPRPPRATTIYRHIDRCGCLLYVGVAYDPVKRNYGHAGSSWWTKWVDRIDLHETVYEDRAEALEAEREFIRAESPVFNTVHALDKRTSIIRYLIRHERWDHLSVASAVSQRDKPDLLRYLDRASLYDGVMYLEEPTAHVIDWQDPVVRRFIVKTELDENGCWRWQGTLGANGYGTFRHEATRLAHRAAYLLFQGPIPDGHKVRIMCGVTGCVAPSHLRAVPEDAKRRTIMGAADLCEKNHPETRPRYSHRRDGRPYCKECARVQEQARRARHSAGAKAGDAHSVNDAGSLG